ncbi:MAG: hypothetical protein QOJ88_445 [Pyrinomonadaceae bacterium]|jgi:hypothetical protein|nr:hypothetical protein [Pyrinomonadaceae bacterium]
MQANSTGDVIALERLVKRAARLQRRDRQLEHVSKQYWTARRVVFAAGMFLCLFLCQSETRTGALIALAFVVAVFCGVALRHKRLRDSITRNSLMLQIKQVHVARITLAWDQLPPSDQTLPDRAHPFAADLDVTGPRSLHRLLDNAVTKEGSARLKSWLLSTQPDPVVIRKRQESVQKLTTYSLFRDKLQMHARLASGNLSGQAEQWDSTLLVKWLDQPVNGKSLLGTVKLLGVLAAANLTLLLLNSFGVLPPLWPLAFIPYVSVMIAKQARLGRAWGEALELEKLLRRFRFVFQYLESEKQRRRPGLTEICAPFLDKQNSPARELRRVGRMAGALGMRTNALLWLLLNALVPWDFYFTYRLELLKKDLAQLLPVWLDAWYELEALNSLANFAQLNPSYTFPEIDSELAGYEAERLGHPLIKREAKVCNDFELKQQGNQIAILTGSNMAGKSTFVRTVGINLCLAYAGAPVAAARLRVSPFRMFTCIKVSDSVQDGISYFYAEVKRLRALLESAEAPDDRPFLFLIDEIFRGTNNRERHLGGRAFLRALSRHATAVGIIATHDLELTKLTDEITGLANFHFRDEVANGRMVFDYRLRPGPCTTTNALEIMRIEGLPVE